MNGMSDGIKSKKYIADNLKDFINEISFSR